MLNKGNTLKIVKFISWAVYYTGAYAVLNLIFARSGIYIVFYHRLGDKTVEGFETDFTVDRESFKKHAKYFKARYEVISMDDAIGILGRGRKISNKYMVLTFDDGYRDNFTYGYEIFKEYDLKPAVYLTAYAIEKQSFLWTDLVKRIVLSSRKEKANLHINENNHTFKIKTMRQKKLLTEYLLSIMKGLAEEDKLSFIEKLKKSFAVVEVGGCDLMLNWIQVKDLMNTGVVIGGHTMNHPIMSKVSEKNLPCEILESKLLIEKRIDKQVLNFAYPNGKKSDYTAFIKREVAKYYQSAVTTISGINDVDSDRYELKRIGLSYDMTLTDLKVKVLYVQIKQTLDNLVRYMKEETHEYFGGK